MAIKSTYNRKKQVKTTRSSSEIFLGDTQCGHTNEDGTGDFIMVFKTSEGSQGHGAQTLSSEHFETIAKAFEFYVEHGIRTIAPVQSDETPLQALQRTIGVQSDGSIVFKLSGSKGSKSTLIDNMDEFKSFAQLFREEVNECNAYLQSLAEDDDVEDND